MRRRISLSLKSDGISRLRLFRNLKTSAALLLVISINGVAVEVDELLLRLVLSSPREILS